MYTLLSIANEIPDTGIFIQFHSNARPTGWRVYENGLMLKQFGTYDHAEQYARELDNAEHWRCNQCHHLVAEIQRGGRPTFQSCVVHRLDMCVSCWEQHGQLYHGYTVERIPEKCESCGKGVGGRCGACHCQNKQKDTASETGSLRARLVLAEEELMRLQARYDLLKQGNEKLAEAVRRRDREITRMEANQQAAIKSLKC